MSERVLSVIAYFFGLPGALIVAFLGRAGDRKLSLHHARRSLELFLFLAFLTGVWFVILYLLIPIPYAGFSLAVSLFGIVAGGGVFCFGLCIMGLVKAVKGDRVLFPLVSSMLERIGPLRKLLGKIDP
ncbi:MAG: hypothetical protein LBE10_09275 [Treponema sp.]|jgi:uncharacterized membrane protein|nr:hypothetical protein [Treponema sp.]